jgi:hypothetical protein
MPGEGSEACVLISESSASMPESENPGQVQKFLTTHAACLLPFDQLKADSEDEGLIGEISAGSMISQHANSEPQHSDLGESSSEEGLDAIRGLCCPHDRAASSQGSFKRTVIKEQRA